MNLEDLEKLFPGKILHLEYPRAYPREIKNTIAIKGIVLGCDPSNFSMKDGSTKLLETVFGIEGKGKDKRYFAGVLENLEQVGLTLDNIYVQNLCRNYFYKVTNDNPIWISAARHWCNTLKKELDDLKIHNNTPIFLTAENLYLSLIKENVKRIQPKEFYQNPDLIPINKNDNYLDRLLIPLYRGGGTCYKITNQLLYKNRIVQILINNL